MEYNTAKNKLVNGEYGRHIQKMVEYAMGIKDRDLRTQQAHAIIRVMSYFLQGSKDSEDYWNRLWDQLFVLSDFKLDVDSPFPKPTPEIERRPNPLPYPKHNIRIPTYGLLIEKIIKKIAIEKASEEKEQTTVNIANYLKKQYLNWNRDSVSDSLIIEHLDTLSGGRLKLKNDFRFASTRDILAELATNNVNNGMGSKKKKKKKKPTATTPAPVTAAANTKKPANNPPSSFNNTRRNKPTK
jgi:hypothetical protein